MLQVLTWFTMQTRSLPSIVHPCCVSKKICMYSCSVLSLKEFKTYAAIMPNFPGNLVPQVFSIELNSYLFLTSQGSMPREVTSACLLIKRQKNRSAVISNIGLAYKAKMAFMLQVRVCRARISIFIDKL